MTLSPSMPGAAPKRVLLVGFGRIACHHVAALEGIPELILVGAVDPSPEVAWSYRGGQVPVFAQLVDGVRSSSPDVVVVLTPTSTHVQVASKIIDLAPGEVILVEKPLAVLNEDRAALEYLAARSGTDVQTIYHIAFAPEVLWAVSRVPSGALGEVTGFASLFLDPYADHPDVAVSSLHSSWYDSGSNALSVLSRFLVLHGATPPEHLENAFSTYRATVSASRRATSGNAIGGGPTLHGPLFTSWEASAPAQSTTLYFSSGAVLVMNHTSTSAQEIAGDAIRDFFAADPSVHRRTLHYQNLYDRLVTHGPDALRIADTDVIQRILESEASSSPTRRKRPRSCLRGRFFTATSRDPTISPIRRIGH